MNFRECRETVTELAQAQGFDGWELECLTNESVLTGLGKDGKLSRTTSRVKGAAFRGIKAGRSAEVFTERLDRQGLERMILTALDDTASLQPGSAGPVYAGGGSYETVNNYDPALDEESFAPELARNIVQKANRGIVFCDEAQVSVYSRTRQVANSAGVELEHRYNYATVLFTATARTPEKMREKMMFASANRADGFDVDGICEAAVSTAKDLLEAETPESGTYSIVFRNDIAGDLVAGFSIFFSGSQVSKGISLVSDKQGSRVAGQAVTLIDDPLLKNGLFSCPFDSQGVPTKSKTILENGVLKEFLHNTATGQAAGDAGSGWRINYDEPLEAAPCNIYVKPGTANDAALCAQMGDGIYLTSLTATFHGAGVNAVSGDFSMPAKGYRVKAGKLCGTYELFTISGNYYELLNNIRAVGDQLAFVNPYMIIPGAPAEYGNYGSPSLLIDGISVSGR